LQDIAQLGINVQYATVPASENALDSLARTARASEVSVSSSARLLSNAFMQTGQAAEYGSRRLSAATSRSRQLGLAAQNASYQIADFAVQVSGGTSVLMALSQQIPQLLGGFGQMGAVLGAVAAVAGGVWLAFGETRTEAEILDDAIKALNDTVDKGRDLLDNYTTSVDDLSAKFGARAKDVKALYDELFRLNGLKLSTKGFTGIEDLLKGNMNRSAQYSSGLRDFFELDSGPRGRRALQQQYDAEAAVFQAKGISEQADAVERLIASTKQLAQFRNGTSAAEQEYIETLVNSLIRLRELEEQYLQTGATAQKQKDAYAQYYRTRVAAAEMLAEKEQELAEKSARANEFAARSRLQSDEALRTAQEQLSALNEQAELAQLISKYGEDSVAVTRRRIDAEREAAQELYESWDISQSLVDELMGAWDAANGLASTDMASTIGAAANAAAALAANMASAARQLATIGRQQAMTRARAETVGNEPARAGAEAVVDFRYSSDNDGGYADIATGRGVGRIVAMENAIRSTAEAAREAEIAVDSADRAFAKLNSPSRGGGGGGGEDRKYQSEAERIIEQARSAAEKYGIELEKLNTLHELGYISAGQFASAQEQLRNAFMETEYSLLISEISTVSQAFGNAVGQAESFSDLMSNLGDVVENTFRRMASSWASEGIETILQALFMPGYSGGSGGGGTGLFGSLFGSLFGGFKATGGSVVPGKKYIVGENRPEVFEPSVPGYIHPSTDMQDSPGSSLPMSQAQKLMVDVRAYVDDDGNFSVAVEKISQKTVDRATPGITSMATSRVQKSMQKSKSFGSL
jgi:hypothetical protein